MFRCMRAFFDSFYHTDGNSTSLRYIQTAQLQTRKTDAEMVNIGYITIGTARITVIQFFWDHEYKREKHVFYCHHCHFLLQ